MVKRSSAKKLGRRRGTSGRSSEMSTFRTGVLVLLATAISLGCLLFVLLMFIGPSATGTLPNGKHVSPDSISRKLPGIPNLLRGKIAPIVDKQQLQPQAQVNLNQAKAERAGLVVKVSQPSIDLNPYNTTTTSTAQYPYSLDPVPEGYNVHTDFVVLGGKRYSEYTTGGFPYAPTVSANIRALSDAQARSRRAYVKQTMEFAWKGYETYAFGQDEVLPQSAKGSDNWGGQGITLVDSLDTLWLMGMTDEFNRARDWVKDHLDHSHVQAVSVFETTIRDLGGLLAAYDWSKDRMFLEKALDLGRRLFHAFDNSPTGIPFGQVNLQSGSANNIGWAGNNAIFSEFGTIQIEFRYLAKLTGDHEFAQKTEHVFEILNEMSPPSGLFPYYFKNNPRNSDKPSFANNKITFGAMADSTYEYMLKIWIQGGKTEPLYRQMYDKAMDGMHAELLQTSTPSGLVYIADKNGGHLDHKMDHLVCFMGGLLALGAYTDPHGLDSPRAQRDLRTAKALTYTCYQMYARMNTGISAEFIQFSSGRDFDIGRGAPHYLLRPEAVESFFILNQLTGDPVYREWGWEVYQAIEKYCKAKVAYGALGNVQQTSGRPRDKMESFFLAETLKYLYLLQDPDTEVDVLHKHVFNTEAHPLRIFPLIDEGVVLAAATTK